MKQKNWIFILGGALLLLFFALLFTDSEQDSDSPYLGESDRKDWVPSSGTGFSFTNFPEAPKPSESESEVSRLWAQALEPKDKDLKNRVREEWKDFAQRYPSNLYLPNEYLSSRSLDENASLETLDSFTGIEANLAGFAASNKFAEGNSEPNLLENKSANPKEMSRYFEYKIREMESRIQLLEYTMEKARLSSIQEATAKKDIKELQKELANLREVQSQIPKS
jgi:hypothetical protein